MQKLIRDLKLYAPYPIFCSFALFGLLNPQSEFDVLQIFLFTFLITHLLYFQRKRHRVFLTTWALTLFTALMAYFIYRPELLTLASTSTFAGVIYFLILHKAAKNLNKIFVVHLIIFFLVSSYVNSYNLRKIISQEPTPKSYFNDYLGFLRNFYLVENGYGYYEGLVITHTEDGRSSAIPQKVWNWRLPTYTYLWKIFPGDGGLSVYVFFLVLSSTALYFTYRIGRIFLNPNHAALVPYVLLPYFHFAARDLSFLAMEWWALPTLIFAVFFYLKNRLVLTLMLSTITLFLRELFLIPIGVFMILLIFPKSYKKVIVFSSSIAIFLIFLGVHYLKVTTFMPRSLESFKPDFQPFDPYIFQQTLSYGSVDYLFFRFRPFLVSLVLTVLSLAIGFYRRKISINLFLIPLTAVSMAIFTLKFATKDADYWGVTFVPLLLISTVILTFKNFLKDAKD